MRLKEQELSVLHEQTKLKEKEEILRVITGEGGATPQFLIELQEMTLSFATVQPQNGHTEQTATKKVTPTS
jgi:hypothetical protein